MSIGTPVSNPGESAEEIDIISCFNFFKSRYCGIYIKSINHLNYYKL